MSSTSTSYTFVETEAHPRLKELTELYRRLRDCNAAAANASADERRYSKELNDLSEQKRYVEKYRVEIVAGSVDDVATNPRVSGFSPEYSRRMMRRSSAVLAARASYDALYEAARDMRAWFDQEPAAQMDINRAVSENGPGWWRDAFSNNIVCSKDLLRKALTTLGSFSDAVRLDEPNEHTPLLSPDERKHLDNFRAQYMKWIRSIPMLPAAAGEWESRALRHLLVKHLAEAGSVDYRRWLNSFSSRWVEEDEKRWQPIIWDLLSAAGWRLGWGGYHGNIQRARRPADSVAPYVWRDEIVYSHPFTF